MVSKVQVAFVRGPGETMEKGQGSDQRRALPAPGVGLSPVSVVSIAVALELGVNAGLVDCAAAFLDLSKCSTPVIVTLVVTSHPITKRSSI